MKRNIIFIIAGFLGGTMGSIMDIMNGSTFRGPALGGLLSLGVLIIEAFTRKDPAKDKVKSKMMIILVSLITGALSGGITHFGIISGPNNNIEIYALPDSFSLPEVVCLISLYPLLMLPAYFANNKYLLILASGTVASFIIEGYRVHFFDFAYIALLSSRGLVYSASWIGALYLVSHPFKSLDGKSIMDYEFKQS